MAGTVIGAVSKIFETTPSLSPFVISWASDKKFVKCFSGVGIPKDLWNPVTKKHVPFDEKTHFPVLTMFPAGVATKAVRLYQRRRYQLNIWAKTQTDAELYAESVKMTIDGLKGTENSVGIAGITYAGNEREAYDDKAERHCRQFDVFILTRS